MNWPNVPPKYKQNLSFSFSLALSISVSILMFSNTRFSFSLCVFTAQLRENLYDFFLCHASIDRWSTICDLIHVLIKSRLHLIRSQKKECGVYVWAYEKIFIEVVSISLVWEVAHSWKTHTHIKPNTLSLFGRLPSHTISSFSPFVSSFESFDIFYHSAHLTAS